MPWCKPPKPSNQRPSPWKCRPTPNPCSHGSSTTTPRRPSPWPWPPKTPNSASTPSPTFHPNSQSCAGHIEIMFPSTSSTCRSAHPRPQTPTNQPPLIQSPPMRTCSHPSTWTNSSAPKPGTPKSKPSPSAPAGKTFAGPPSPSEWAPAWPNRALTPTMHAGKHTCGRGLPNWGRKPWW